MLDDAAVETATIQTKSVCADLEIEEVLNQDLVSCKKER